MTTLFDSVTRIARHEAAARPAVAIGVVRDNRETCANRKLQ